MQFKSIHYQPEAPALRWVVGSKYNTELLEEFVCYWHNGAIYVPAGFVTDGPSVPEIARSFLTVTWLEWPASIIHDWQYVQSRQGEFADWTRKNADDLFKAGLLKTGTSSHKARLMYNAVRQFGWTYWGDGRKDIDSRENLEIGR